MKRPRLVTHICTAVIAGLLVSGGPFVRAAAAQEKPDSITVGRKLLIVSKILNETREVWIALPAGYENSRERFPVLFQLGGSLHFMYSSAVVDLLSRNDHIPPMIVAALLDPTPRHHYRDSTPTKVDYLPASGGASQFLTFLNGELIPYLEASFRTRPFRILCGHGLSGLFAVYALLESPGTFGAIITDGASLTYDGSVILKAAETKLADPRLRGSLFLGVGNELETIPGLQALADLLEKKAPPGLEWKMEVEKDEDQGTASLPVFFKGLKWLYRDWRLPVEVAAKGMDAVKAYCAGLSRKYGYDIPVTEKTLAARGFQLIREQRFDDAAGLFMLNARTYPDSHQVYHNLALLYERLKDWKKAAAYYEKAAEKAGPTQPELENFYRMQAERLKKR
jgi:predicted alpha/beta superfamily hydrolase